MQDLRGAQLRGKGTGGAMVLTRKKEKKMFQRCALLALMVLPVIALGQTKMLSEVCADPPQQKSCIGANSALALVFPGSRQSQSEALLSPGKTASLVYLQRLSLTGAEPLALGIAEVVEKDAATGTRPDCRACVPNMVMSVFEFTQGQWRVAAQSKAMDGVGGGGQLRTDLKTVDLGRRRLLIAMETGFTGQGVTETVEAYYFANLESSGRLSRAVIDIGFIPTGTYSCGSGLGQEEWIIETDVLVLRKTDLMPEFLTVRTDLPCKGNKAAQSSAPVMYRVNAKTLKIERAR